MYPFPFTAVISAHPIHSLDNHHHHYHMGSLVSPTRSYLYHQGSGHPRPHACASPISHLDRVDSTGETLPPAGQQEDRGSYSFIDYSFPHSLTFSCHVHILVFHSVTNRTSLLMLSSARLGFQQHKLNFVVRNAVDMPTVKALCHLVVSS